MNKTPIAVGLAMIMGISVVFAFDRVKPTEGAAQPAKVAVLDAASTPELKTAVVVAPVPEIEASILMDEAPIILDNISSVYGAENVTQLSKSGNRSLRDALAEMQKALQVLEREAALTHRAVAALERQYQL